MYKKTHAQMNAERIELLTTETALAVIIRLLETDLQVQEKGALFATVTILSNILQQKHLQWQEETKEEATLQEKEAQEHQTKNEDLLPTPSQEEE